jgi:hypothetical protein
MFLLSICNYSVSWFDSRYLINASGSGKTRLMLEGLARNWGIYLSCAGGLTELRSHDLQGLRHDVPNERDFTVYLPQADAPGYQSMVDRNRAIVRRHLRRLILARLLVLHQFLRVARDNLLERFEKSLPFLRLNWLMMQLFPTAFPRSAGPETDVFVAMGSLVQSLDDQLLNIKIQTTMSLIRSFIHSPTNDRRATIDHRGLFCVINKAQVEATPGYESFRGSGDSPGSYFWEFASTIREIGGLTLVVAGTSPSVIKLWETLESGIGKSEIIRDVYDTGWFRDSEAQRHYLDLYLPASFLKSNVGLRIASRMALWLHGRYEIRPSR